MHDMKLDFSSRPRYVKIKGEALTSFWPKTHIYKTRSNVVSSVGGLNREVASCEPVYFNA